MNVLSKKIKKWIIAGVMAVVGVAGVQQSDAAGLLIADGGFGGVLEIREQDVDVTINNGIAVTRVTQVFKNTENRQVEALYTFPVPKGASVANFSMWINGKEMVGEVLEKERAREIYNSYKAKRRDPGLLEQKDYKTFEMRIFPIAAQAEQRVEITYYQEIDFDHDWIHYIYPLATVTHPEFNQQTAGTFSMTMRMKSAVPIERMESPSHPDDFAVVQFSEGMAEATLETKEAGLNRDLVLACKLTRPKTGLDLITSREESKDGFFCLTLTAGEDLGSMNTGMDYVFVLDISGSMGHDGKLLMSKDSVQAFISELAPEDRFEVMTINTQPETVFGELRTADETHMQQAGTFLAGQRAKGGTFLNPAVLNAYTYQDPDRPLNVIILSDGMTEQRERTSLLQLIQQRPSGSKVFCIGVGNEVDKPLLEQLAHDSGGLSAFISRGSDFERQAKAFRRKLTHPVASGLSLTFEGVQVYDVEPRLLPNLYHGAPIRLYGRYKGDGPARVSLKADIRGAAFERDVTLTFPEQDDGNPEIERMWAWHRIDQLLKRADRNGSRKPVLDEVIRLGEAYSIVTEYTSFLVLENDEEYQRWKIERRNLNRITRDRAAQRTAQELLEQARAQAAADLGPQPEAETADTRQAQAPTAQPSSPRTQPASRSQGVDFDMDVGTGPVGPLFVLGAALLRRKRKHQA